MDWYLDAWRDGLKFSGRSRRREYAWFTLGTALGYLYLTLMFRIFPPSFAVFSTLLLWVALIPYAALLVRRLHDLGWSGWLATLQLGWVFSWPIWLAILVGFGLLAFNIVLLTREGHRGANGYGPDPRGGALPAHLYRAAPEEPDVATPTC